MTPEQAAALIEIQRRLEHMGHGLIAIIALIVGLAVCALVIWGCSDD